MKFLEVALSISVVLWNLHASDAIFGTNICKKNICKKKTCPAHPTAKCVGICRTHRFLLDKKPVKCGCQSGASVVRCMSNPCTNAKCYGVTDVQCRPSWCGSCHAVFYNGIKKATCPGHCNLPVAPINGHVVSSGQYSDPLVGEYAKYSCADGYHLAGETQRKCKNDKSFAGIQPSCKKICNIPNLPSKLSLTNGGQKLEGDALHFACETGYDLTGSSSLICTSTGALSGNLPNCAATGCIVKSFSNGYSTDTDGNTIAFGSKVATGAAIFNKCNDDYHLLFSYATSKIICQASGKFKSSKNIGIAVPRCSKCACNIKDACKGKRCIRYPNAQCQATSRCNTCSISFKDTDGSIYSEEDCRPRDLPKGHSGCFATSCSGSTCPSLQDEYTCSYNEHTCSRSFKSERAQPHPNLIRKITYSDYDCYGGRLGFGPMICHNHSPPTEMPRCYLADCNIDVKCIVYNCQPMYFYKGNKVDRSKVCFGKAIPSLLLMTETP